MYCWEIRVRGGKIVMKSNRDFPTYDEAKTNLIENINGEFQKIRMMSLKYNYTIYDKGVDNY